MIYVAQVEKNLLGLYTVNRFRTPDLTFLI